MSELLFNRISEVAKKKKGMSVKELGLKLDLGENAIYAWKKSKPSIEKLQRVADYLNVSTDYLLGRTNTESVEGEQLSEQERKLLLRFRRGSENLNEEEKAIYERQAMNLFDYINKTMHDLDEKNKPK